MPGKLTVGVCVFAPLSIPGPDHVYVEIPIAVVDTFKVEVLGLHNRIAPIGERVLFITVTVDD